MIEAGIAAVSAVVSAVVTAKVATSCTRPYTGTPPWVREMDERRAAEDDARRRAVEDRERAQAAREAALHTKQQVEPEGEEQ